MKWKPFDRFSAAAVVVGVLVLVAGLVVYGPSYRRAFMKGEPR
jgi:hypothetical protein